MNPLITLPRPKDFVVEELLKVKPGKLGDCAVYRVTKQLLTTPELQRLLAQELGKPPMSLVFPALKDKRALTTQHFSVRGRWPTDIRGERFNARFVGRMERHLGPHDLNGNRFAITCHELNDKHIEKIPGFLEEMTEIGLPNYFDEQRFASYTPGGVFIGKAVVQRDAEGALKSYMAQVAPGDSPKIRRFKDFAQEHWGDWPAVIGHAPQSNYRSILTFLRRHPQDFRKAMNLITPGLVPVLLAAYQSFLWNRVVSRVLTRKLRGQRTKTDQLMIAGEPLLLYDGKQSDNISALEGLSVPLPNHQMEIVDTDVRDEMGRVLGEEGLTPGDMKARMMKRAYLTKNIRPVLVHPRDVGIVSLRGNKLRLKFVLPPGSYGTMTLKVLMSRFK